MIESDVFLPEYARQLEAVLSKIGENIRTVLSAEDPEWQGVVTYRPRYRQILDGNSMALSVVVGSSEDSRLKFLN